MLVGMVAASGLLPGFQPLNCLRALNTKTMTPAERAISLDNAGSRAGQRQERALEPSRRAPALDADEELVLVRAAAGGDRAAFARLYVTHRNQVYGLALRMVHCPEWAEDVCQEAFLAAWTTLRSFRETSRFGGWMYGVTLRKALHHLRAERRRRGRLLRYAEDRYEAALQRSVPELRIDLERAIAALPDRARAVLLLHLSGSDHADIVEQLEITIGTVKSQLHRARRLVLESMDR